MREQNMTALEKFVKLPTYYAWLKYYDSGDEHSLAKDIPVNDENMAIIKEISKVVPIQRRYRGPRLHGGFCRECHRQDAERVSIYLRRVA